MGEFNTGKEAFNEMPRDSQKILKIEYRDTNTRYIVFLKLDTRALFNLNLKPIDTSLQGADLVDALCRSGAVYNDFKGEPAEQRFDIETGKRIFLRYYQNNKIQDPEKGKAAHQEFHPDTEQQTVFIHYQSGLRQDPEKSEPAWQEFDATTGQRIFLMYHQAGRLQDPENGEPARQIFNANTGFLAAAESWPSDGFKHDLTADELLALAKRTNMPPPLPKHLRGFEP